ncbi:MAG: hypothetical protein HC888_04770 [Candidatus Competibacteraceae bacterium]|nr:hypothetical protein [Candidatus Competibacteraceae bacterium]
MINTLTRSEVERAINLMNGCCVNYRKLIGSLEGYKDAVRQAEGGEFCVCDYDLSDDTLDIFDGIEEVQRDYCILLRRAEKINLNGTEKARDAVVEFFHMHNDVEQKWGRVSRAMNNQT